MIYGARANLSAKRVTASYDATATNPEHLVATLERAGFKAAEVADARETAQAREASDLLRRMGVAGFAAANVMLLSVSVWAGLASDMDASAQALFHWLSALIALPAIAYSGQPFFRSAVAALRAGRLNMDVPISLGIILASGMSLFQTMRGSDQVYFDAAIMLTFLLLIGRFLDDSGHEILALEEGKGRIYRIGVRVDAAVFHDGETGREISVTHLLQEVQGSLGSGYGQDPGPG